MAALFSVILIVCCALAMMALEAFIPGVSIAGVAGVLLFGFAAYLCWKAYGLIASIILLVFCAVLSFLLMRAVFRSMKHGRLSKAGMFLNNPVPPAVKTSSCEKQIQPGSVGAANSPLHPSGIAEFDRERIHVVSDSGFIEKGEKVTVVRVEGAKVVVRRTEE